MQPNMMKNKMDEKEILNLLNRTDVGVLSTNGEDGFPYASPVNYVIMDGDVYIHGRKIGEKVENIERDPRVCFTVWERTGYEDCGTAACDTTTVYESVIIRGKVKIIDDSETKKKMLLEIVDKLVPGKTGMDDKKIPPTIVYKIEAESVTGKYHKALAENKVHMK
jgi:nitroimidazol reductase NimA-like FMN-containing flavoprotein (pyridoxamine 5'-phosphate oxidase superfamily)